MTKLGRNPFLMIAGIPVLLVISLVDLYGTASERRQRDLVLATGRDSQAIVQGSSGIESVTLKWVDWAGRTRIADAATGKPFARRARENSGSTRRSVMIKYADDPDIAPVILSEAAERERMNAWWLWTSGGVAAVTATFCAVGFAMFLYGRRSPPHQGMT